jgi:hypothetical protein
MRTSTSVGVEAARRAARNGRVTPRGMVAQ